MAQKGELKCSMHTYAPLVLTMNKEVLLHTSDIAGSLPSVVSHLQDCQCVHRKEPKSLDVGKIHWDDPNEFKEGQGELMVVVNTTTMMYVFKHIRGWYKCHVDFCEMFKECMKLCIIVFDDERRDGMDCRCGMIYLHDLKLFDVVCKEIMDGGNEFYAHYVYSFKENKFFLYISCTSCLLVKCTFVFGV